ncbi:MAG: carboxylesterase family protein [Xanthobacteraceae bacterium]|nr:carboxylesterase family protein [Xanthobacteraceae bacterium]
MIVDRTPTLAVETPAGRIVGLQRTGCAVFLGIPYAAPPVGALRFKPPQEVPPSHGAIDATAEGLSPPQVRRNQAPWAPRRTPIITGEDCLNLNVFTPAADAAGRPVIVHVFGGGFEGGSANGGYQDNEGFATINDLVLVRVNFRVGVLGFLDLSTVMDDPAYTANAGVLDLTAALRWVRANIAAFGGDPGNVTLMGLSSGAFMIASLFGIPAAAGLFRRVWLMSGSASRVITKQTADAMARSFLEHAGVAAGDAAALSALPIETVLEVQQAIIETDLGIRNAPGGHTLSVVADGRVLTRHPLDALKAGAGNGIEMVAGWTRDEAHLWYAMGVMKPPADRASLLRTVARFHGAEAGEVLAGFEARMPGASLAAIEERFLSETIYRNPARATAAAQVAAGGTAWTYEFAWAPATEGGVLGASHGFDEPFVFGNVEADRIPYAAGSPRAQPLAAEMSAALRQFVRGSGMPWPQARGTHDDFRIFS